MERCEGDSFRIDCPRPGLDVVLFVRRAEDGERAEAAGLDSVSCDILCT